MSDGRFRHLLEHLAHVLPGQAPLRDFVHHNTLHGFQHLPFPQALQATHDLTGTYGYLPVAKYRDYFRSGRISAADLQAVLLADSALDSAACVFSHAGGTVTRGDIYCAAMIVPLNPLTHTQFIWQLEETNVLEEHASLWAACLAALQCGQGLQHSEDWAFASQQEGELTDRGERLHHDAQRELLALTQRVGTDLTLRGLLLAVTGTDIMHDIRPLLLRQMAAWLDQGMAAWTNGHYGMGLYAAWRESSLDDLTPLLEELPDWREHLTSLPDDPVEAITAELQRISL